ncbi:MAG: LytR C-terminal domain-containing protein [Candidatus Cloacimonetes bacterium]|nr:LytR C-terminal domain-containing protein [Candidatus Cloacimonadota bacterium]
MLILMSIFLYLIFTEKKSVPEQSDAQEVIVEESSPAVKIILLNGCGIEKIASDVKEILQAKNLQNLDIIAWQNVERDLFIYEKSLIVVKKNDPEKLKYIIGVTGINRRIFAENEDSIEDFQIILGKDYRNYFN